MNPFFSAGDWVVIVAYLGEIVGLGVWFGKDQRTTRDYFLGSRSVPWWGIGFSIVAAEANERSSLGWSNERHEGLGSFCRRACRFDPYLEHQQVSNRRTSSAS